MVLGSKPLDPPTREHVEAICRPGAGPQTCRYLAMSPAGWSCEKFTALAATIDARVAAETMGARAVNCSGLGAARPV